MVCLLGSEPVEQREELLALGGLEAATELLLVLEGDRVEQIDVGYGTFWVAWGIAAIVLSLALGPP